jgi:hypothetical protein
MSKYTTELRHILQSEFDLGMDTYPIFSSAYRDALNNKIFNHYMFHEIGFETAGRFKHYLNTTMNEIMPYYNKLYQSELLTINPLLSFERKTDSTKDIGSTVTKEVDNTANSTGNSTTIGNNDSTQNTTLNSNRNNDSSSSSKDKDVFSDTPKGLLNNEDIEADYFATDARVITNNDMKHDVESLVSSEGIVKGDTTNNNTDMSSEITSNEEATEITTLNETNVVTENGFEIPLSDLLLKYRETFLNIDLMIIKDLKDLFLMIY